jgi:hypothetical protein
MCRLLIGAGQRDLWGFSVFFFLFFGWFVTPPEALYILVFRQTPQAEESLSIN